MDKAIAIGEIFLIIRELLGMTSDFFSKSIPDNLYSIMDKLTFLTSDFLEIGSDGKLLDGTDKIAEAIMNLSNIVIWGILIFFGFKSLFSYFLSKKVDMPWKFFVRMIVFGVFANAAFFICYTGVFFAENCTDYIRSYVGNDKISFSILEEFIEPEVEDNEEGVDIYNLNSLMNIFSYFLTFFTLVCLGGRFILIKVLILFSPIFFIFGGFKCSEKIFYKWVKWFVILIFMQMFLSVVLGICTLSNIDDKMILEILISSIMIIFCKNIFSFLNLSH